MFIPHARHDTQKIKAIPYYGCAVLPWLFGSNGVVYYSCYSMTLPFHQVRTWQKQKDCPFGTLLFRTQCDMIDKYK